MFFQRALCANQCLANSLEPACSDDEKSDFPIFPIFSPMLRLGFPSLPTTSDLFPDFPRFFRQRSSDSESDPFAEDVIQSESMESMESMDSSVVSRPSRVSVRSTAAAQKVQNLFNPTDSVLEVLVRYMDYVAGFLASRPKSLKRTLHFVSFPSG